MKKNILLITTCLITHLATAQVLLSEDFNSYPAGHLNTDYTGNTAGQGGWVTERHGSVTAMVTPETGKGNVVSITTSNNLNEGITIQQNMGVINALWNNRTTGNNVLKYEYEVYGIGWFNTVSGISYTTTSNGAIIDMRLYSSGNSYIETLQLGAIGGSYKRLKNYTSTTFPHNLWLKVELYVDYDSNKFYTYLPTLNLFSAGIKSSSIADPHQIYLFTNALKPGTVVKYDNIKLTALPSVPTYILSANEIVSAKFNMYPNPATNVVNITNSENMLVEQVTIYDSIGKQLNTQSFNNQTEIQLNVENLASGTYMLHIQTNAGLAVKKLVKK